MSQRLFLLVPEQAYILLLLLAGLMLIVGLRRPAASLAAIVILLALLGPFMGVLVDALPCWLFVLSCLGLLLSVLRMILGNAVVNNVLSFLIYDLIRAPFRFFAWILRGFGPRRRQ